MINASPFLLFLPVLTVALDPFSLFLLIRQGGLDRKENVGQEVSNELGERRETMR